MPTRLSLPLGKNITVTCVLDLMHTHTTGSEPSTLPPTASLSTQAVLPSELPPTHEVPLNILAPTVTTNTSRLSWAEVAKLPAKTDTKYDFEDLIVVLGDLSANGNPRPRLSTVAQLLRGRRPDLIETTGVTQFKAYLQLAESAGIVAVEQHQDGDGWITLRHPRNTGPNGPPQHAGSRFCDLIKILNDLQLTGDHEPRFSIVSRLLRKNPSVYKDANVTKFKEYVEAAVETGVITVRGVKNGEGWLKLCPVYNNPPVHSSISASTPPTHTASTTSPFAPLVDFLQSKQSRSAQPIPFSDILAHLILTLGYPDLLSLYTSVPGVTTFSQYIDAAITSRLVSLVSGTTASRDALVSLRDAKSSIRMGPQLPAPVNPTIPQGGPFEPLISVLTKLRREGKQEPTLSEIHPLILAQDIMAYGRVGVKTINDYTIKAATANLIIYNPPRAPSMAVTIRLREPPKLPDDPSPPAQPSVSTTTPLPPLPPPQEITVSPQSVNVAPSSFRDLVAVLTKLRASMGESESRFSSVVPLLLTRKPNAYASVGVTKFTDYINLAMENGVVRIRWVGRRDGWVSLVTQDPKE